MKLFERRPNGLALTAQGKMLQPGLTAAFDAIADHMAKVIAMKSTPVLTLGVGPSFAMRWLIPRLASFHAKHPNIEVRLATGGAINPFNDEWTCGILLGNGDWEGYTAEPLFSAELIPVCAPAIAKRLKDPSQLAKESLLQVGHAPEDWALWLDGAGLSLPPATHAITFDNYGMAVQAAIDGVGVTIAVRSYVEDDIRSGKLVAPFPLAVPKGQAWYIVYRTYREGDAGLIAFRAWMQEQSRAKKAARQKPRGDPSF